MHGGYAAAAGRPRIPRSVKFAGEPLDVPASPAHSLPSSLPCSPAAAPDGTAPQRVQRQASDELRATSAGRPERLRWTASDAHPILPVSVLATPVRRVAASSDRRDEAEPRTKKRFESRSRSWGAGLNLQTEEGAPANGAISPREPAERPGFEFSLVEDLATGSSIYQHKYSEKLAAMDICKSTFLSRLLGALLGPFGLSIPLVADAMQQLLDVDEASCRMWCKPVEAVFSILLLTVLAGSVLMVDDRRFSGEGLKMVGLYCIVGVLHAAINSPADQHANDDDDLAPPRLPGGANGCRIAGDARAAVLPPTLTRQNSADSANRLPSREEGSRKIGGTERDASGDESDGGVGDGNERSDGCRAGQQPRSLPPGSRGRANGERVREGGGVLPENGALEARGGHGDEPLEARAGEVSRDVMFTELQERWRHMQRATVAVRRLTPNPKRLR